MKTRIAETPWGAARVAYAYLGTLVAGLVTGLVAVIAYPITQASSTCQGDTRGFCAAIMTGWVATAVGVLCLVAAAYVLRFGWVWAAWFVVLLLVVAQLVAATGRLWVAWCALLVPAAAALATLERPDAETPRRVVVIRLAILAALVVEVVVWFAWWVSSPA